jgi:hypothetical protein
MGGPVASWPRHSSRLAESGRLVRRMSHHVDPAANAEEARTVRLDAILGPPRRSVPVGDSSTPESRTLTPSIMVRIQVPACREWTGKPAHDAPAIAAIVEACREWLKSQEQKPRAAPSRKRQSGSKGGRAR